MADEFAERKLKNTSSGPRYVLMLQIDRGEKTPMPFRQTNLSDDKIVVTIDEYDNMLYLWYGKNCSEINKKLALNTAQSIKKIGYKHDQLNIGHCLKDIKIIDESTLNDPETRKNHSELPAIFNRKFAMKDKFLVEVISKPQVAYTAPPPLEQEVHKTPEPEPQTTVSEPAVKTAEPLTAQPTANS
ncbi:MAG: hypothetical protein QW279_16155 [Candidatus Jordarchaeaceae archaeon]